MDEFWLFIYLSILWAGIAIVLFVLIGGMIETMYRNLKRLFYESTLITN